MVEKLQLVVKLLSDKQAQDITSIEMHQVTPFVDYFVIADVNNIRQLNGLKDYLVDEMSRAGYPAKRIEGNKESHWLLLDFGDIVIHLFEKEERQLFHLEKLWGDLPQAHFE